MKPEAWLSDDGQTVHMRRGGWAGEFPVSELSRWIAFYRELESRARDEFAPDEALAGHIN